MNLSDLWACSRAPTASPLILELPGGKLALTHKLHAIIKLHLQRRNCTHYWSLQNVAASPLVIPILHPCLLIDQQPLTLDQRRPAGTVWSALRMLFPLIWDQTELKGHWVKRKSKSAHVVVSHDLNPSNFPLNEEPICNLSTRKKPEVDSLGWTLMWWFDNQRVLMCDVTLSFR